MPIQDVPGDAEDLFCFAVYTASHTINRAYGPHLKALGLTYPQYITLTLLWQQDGQKVGELARRLHIDTSTLTPLLKRLEALGHVRRVRGQEDEREVFIYLSESGARLQKHAPGITQCMIAGTKLSMSELSDLQHLLTKLRNELGGA